MKDIQFTIADLGAELVSIQSEGREYMWNGDPKYWSRRAPILFPIVGRLANDILRIGGRSYTMKQHGFARDTEFVRQDGYKPSLLGGAVDVQTINGPLIFKMYQEGTHANYPYVYDLEVRYEVVDNTVCCSWTVKNQGTEPMHFQIGAHPAFMLPKYDASKMLHGYFCCYNADGQIVLPISSSHLEDGLRVIHEPIEVENKGGFIPITNNSFVDDAILLDSGNISSIALFDVIGREVLRVVCPQAEVYGLWAPNKPGCPFVCIEPWCGVADKVGFVGDISERDYNHSLKPNEGYVFSYMIQIA